jgi:hypothetical protein
MISRLVVCREHLAVDTIPLGSDGVLEGLVDCLSRHAFVTNHEVDKTTIRMILQGAETRGDITRCVWRYTIVSGAQSLGDYKSSGRSVALPRQKNQLCATGGGCRKAKEIDSFSQFGLQKLHALFWGCGTCGGRLCCQP